MPARQTSATKPKTSRSNSNKSAKPNSNPVSVTPRSSSVNEDYHATVAYNKELTEQLIGQKTKKMQFVQVEEDVGEIASIQQYSQPADKEPVIDPKQLDSGDEDSQPLEQNNGKALKDDTEEEESDEEDSFDPAAFNGTCIQKRTKSIAFAKTPQF